VLCSRGRNNLFVIKKLPVTDHAAPPETEQENKTTYNYFELKTDQLNNFEGEY